MPGMMETILDAGLNGTTVAGLAAQSGDERFAWDSYRRLIQMFGKTVFGVPGEDFQAEPTPWSATDGGRLADTGQNGDGRYGGEADRRDRHVAALPSPCVPAGVRASQPVRRTADAAEDFGPSRQTPGPTATGDTTSPLRSPGTCLQGAVDAARSGSRGQGAEGPPKCGTPALTGTTRRPLE
jgi:hypothetical protein